MKRIPPIVPIVAVLVGAALGACSGLYIKRVQFSSLAFSGFRMGVPFLCMLPIMIRGKRVLGEGPGRRIMWIASAISAVRMLLFVTAYKLTSVGNAVVLLYLWPVFAMIFDGLRLKRRPTWAQIGLEALSFAGVVAMNLHRGLSLSNADLLGSLTMILSSALFAATNVIFKNALATVHETDTLYFQNAIGALVFLPFMAAEAVKAPAVDIVLGLAYGLSVGLVAFALYFFSMKRLPLFQYSTLSYAEVPLAVLLGVLILGEGFGANQVAGALMIVAASFLAQRVRSSPGGGGKA